jgi:long-chain acyl-CoA synthetase
MAPRPWHRYYDDSVPPSLTFDDLTLPQLLERAARRYPNRPALIFFNNRLSYRTLQDQVDRLATALGVLGVRPGDKVGIQLPNMPQFVIAFYAVQRAGAVAVPTNPSYTPREIEHQWTDAECVTAILADVIYEHRVKPIRDRLPVRHYIVASAAEYLRFPLTLLAPGRLRRQSPPLAARVVPAPNVHLFRKLVAATSPRPPAAEVGMEDLATLIYTGGTTGVSKGAALTQRNLSYNAQQLRAWFAEARDGQEVMMGLLPFFHSYGLTVSLNMAIILAGTNVLIPDPRRIRDIVRSVIKHRVTLFPAAPATFQAICSYPGVERLDLSSIKLCNSGSAPLAVEVLYRFEELTGAKISEGYGLTEASPVTHSNPLYGTRKPGSIGVPLPDTDIRVVDAGGGTTVQAPGEVGELIIRGPQVMQGYWKKPDETARVLRDGWLHTGDLVRMDQDGFCFVVGRKKDMILCSGYNVYPDEIDRVLMSHPAVLEAATIGLPDQRRGETVKSFVVVRPGHQLTIEQVVAHCRDNLAPYKVPRAVEFRDALPRSAVLKILRRELRDQELEKLRSPAGEDATSPSEN